MAKKRKSAAGKCAGRTAKGGLKKGYKLMRGRSCPVKVGSSGAKRRRRRRR